MIGRPPRSPLFPSTPLFRSAGRAPEPPAEILRNAPEAYRARQLRAVTLEDYRRRAEEVPGIARAAAQYAWTGSWRTDRKSTRLNSSHLVISYAVFCLKKKKT